MIIRPLDPFTLADLIMEASYYDALTWVPQSGWTQEQSRVYSEQIAAAIRAAQEAGE